MIKGRYVALVELDFHIDESLYSQPFEDMKNDITNGNLTEMIKELLEIEIDDLADINVTQQYADMYKVEDGDSDDE